MTRQRIHCQVRRIPNEHGEEENTPLGLVNDWQVRHIPNKYTQRMLLSVIEQNHSGQFDLLYLPIDFKNRCNVG